MDRSVTNIYATSKVAIEQSPYLKFANMHLMAMMKRCRENLNSVINNINDPDLKILVNSHYQVVFENYCKELADIPLADKPLFRLTTPREHHCFYDSLITNKLPYQPFTPK
jgi:hypothetical protein